MLYPFYHMHAGRRKFLKTSFLGLAGIGIAAPFVLKSKMVSSMFSKVKGLDHCPFDGDANAYADSTDGPAFPPDPIMKITDPVQKDFSGDRFTRPHRALWDKQGYLKSKGGIPVPSETTEVVVVGGGIAGLTAAYSMMDLKPVVLEQAAQFGGNAKGESWEGSAYTIGAAYIDVPDEGSFHAQMLKDLKLDTVFRTEEGKGEAILMKGVMKAPFWQGVTDPPNAAEFSKVFDKMIEIGTTSALPQIPPVSDRAKRDEFDRLDSMSFTRWCAQTFGKIHPHIDELFREYCWSSFGSDMDEISAAQALNFLCSDLQTIAAFPGGNSAISQALYEKLLSTLPDCSLRPSCLVIDVSNASDGSVHVCYEGPDGNLRTIQAKACVMTSAKFISKILVSGMPDSQIDAIESIDYRAYVVANVLIKGPIKSPGYDVYCMQGIAPHDPQQDIASRVYTDATFSTWTQHDQSPHGVLSLYRPYPYDGGRQELYGAGAFPKLMADFKKAVPDLVKFLGIDPADIVTIRLTRWGHPIPVARTGMIANGTLEAASAPVGKIFFGQQDNWANPCFETASTSGKAAADQARKAIGRA